MTELAAQFRSYVMSRAQVLVHMLPGCTVETPDDEHIALVTEGSTAHVNFYELDPGAPEIVELNIIPAADPDNPTFFLHFEMDDLDHAKKLFDELTDALAQAVSKRTTKVLLTCTSALTTTFFARKLAEAAATLSLDYEFEAKPIAVALTVAGDYDAVMLAPQVHARRAEMVERHPNLVVFEIPGAVFGSYDAGSALRLLLEARSEHALAARLEQADTRIVRSLDNDRRILVIGVVFGPDSGLYRYRVYDHGEVALDGSVERWARDLRDIEDVLATVRLAGFSLRDFDAVGLALPGRVDGEVLHNVGNGYAGHDFSALRDKLAGKGVMLLVDNNANAAAAGCYVSQDSYENVALYRQPTGYVVGGAGLVADGRLVRGAHGLAGELGYLVNTLVQRTGIDGTRERLRAQAWTAEGMRILAAAYLMCLISVASPEVVYVAADLLEDTEALGEELGRWLPEGTVPELRHVCDYQERVLVGEYALCVDALRRGGTKE